jgi:hypothetical protein
LTGEKLKVLYIGGPARSGSTILQNILGEVDGFFAAGELHYLWRRVMEQASRCGCGSPFYRCPLWSDVLERVLSVPPASKVGVAGLREWQHATVRLRHTGQLLRQSSHSRTSSPLQPYARSVVRLYEAIADVTGARVIVDSSKKSSEAALLRLLPEIDSYVLHLVRDPRAVAHSWSRLKMNVDTDGRREGLPQHGALFSSLQWIQVNLMTEAVRRRGVSGRSMLIRYEDFARAPEATVRGVVNLVNEAPRELPFLDERTVRLGINHTVWGNMDRFKTGVVTVRQDEEWKTTLSRRDRVVASAVTLPVLHHYGYRVRL